MFSTMHIRPYVREDLAAIRAFEERLKLHNPAWSFEPPDLVQKESPAVPSRLQMIVASDADGVHGGYTMRVDHFSLDDSPLHLNYFGFPISEGVMDRKYAVLGLKLQRDIQHRTEFAYGLGGGGISSQVNQLKIRGGWSACDVPFWVSVNRPAEVLRKLPLIRRSVLRSTVASLLVNSGCASLAGVAHRSFFRRRRELRCRLLSSNQVHGFSAWVDELHDRCKACYRLLARRDRVALEKRFPGGLPHLHRVEVLLNDQPIGWFVALDRVFNKQKHFGDLKVGFFLDCLALPEHALYITAAATDFLSTKDVDVVVCNASHRAWNNALRRCGYLKGPSNFPCLASPALAQRLGSMEDCLAESHLMRADGDHVRAMLPAEHDSAGSQFGAELNSEAA